MKKIITIFFSLLILCCFVSAQDLPLTILEKPTPIIPDEVRQTHLHGVIRLRIEFSANGEVGRIVPISSLPYGLTDNTILAAKKIKFQPEVKNGTTVTVHKIVEYGFQHGWIDTFQNDEKAEAIIKRAVEKMGGEKYLQAKSMLSTGNYATIIEGQTQSFSSFTDVLVFPDKERTEFKQNGVKNIQTNAGASGWLFDGSARIIKEQSKTQVADFQRNIRASLDNLLRGEWRKIEGANVVYAGRRQAGIGKRNDVVKLTYPDGLTVEYEFSDDGFPAKTIYKRTGVDTVEEFKEEDRYGQFIEFQGIYTPFVIDHYTNDKHASRINYVTIEFNKNIPDTVFTKPGDLKDLKKDLKF